MHVIENEIDDMVPIIFSNKTNLPINMSVSGIQDNYDMFCFCMDLFIKGIIYLYGNRESKLNIATLSNENIENVIFLMKKAGVNVIFHKIPLTIRLMNAVSIPPKNEEKKELSDYVLEIIIDNVLYKISYEFIRPI